MIASSHAGCLQVLFHTDVKTDGACTILEALTSNSTLQKLDLGGNDLGPEVISTPNPCQRVP